MSRHHADITVLPTPPSPTRAGAPSRVRIKDVSKFVQTSVNGALLTPAQRELELNDGDILTFGACTETFRLTWDPVRIIVAQSSISHEIKMLAISCDVELVPELCERCTWAIISHLTRDDDLLLQCIMAGKRLLSPEFLKATSLCQSGSAAVPRPEDYAVHPSNASVVRSRMFAHLRFILTPGTADVVESLVRNGGGRILANVTRTVSDVIVVHDSYSQPTFDYRVELAKLITSDQVRDAVLNGSLTAIETSLALDLGPTVSQSTSRDFRATGWIGANQVDPAAPAGRRERPTEVAGPHDAHERVPARKAFKKAKLASSGDAVVPLQPWSGNARTSQRSSSDLLLKKAEDGMDAWLYSYNSQ